MNRFRDSLLVHLHRSEQVSRNLWHRNTFLGGHPTGEDEDAVERGRGEKRKGVGRVWKLKSERSLAPFLREFRRSIRDSSNQS